MDPKLLATMYLLHSAKALQKKEDVKAGFELTQHKAYQQWQVQ